MSFWDTHTHTRTHMHGYTRVRTLRSKVLGQQVLKPDLDVQPSRIQTAGPPRTRTPSTLQHCSSHCRNQSAEQQTNSTVMRHAREKPLPQVHTVSVRLFLARFPASVCTWRGGSRIIEAAEAKHKEPRIQLRSFWRPKMKNDLYL